MIESTEEALRYFERDLATLPRRIEQRAFNGQQTEKQEELLSALPWCISALRFVLEWQAYEASQQSQATN